jgi:hypothetical protein
MPLLAPTRTNVLLSYISIILMAATLASYLEREGREQRHNSVSVVVAPHSFSLRGHQTISFNTLIALLMTVQVQSFVCSLTCKEVHSKHMPCLPSDRGSIQTCRATTCRARSCIAAVAFACGAPATLNSMVSQVDDDGARGRRPWSRGHQRKRAVHAVLTT